MTPAQQALLEKRGRWDVGRDPRQVSRDELIAAGHEPMSAQRALRARCLDCCAGSANEVRLCTAVSCPAWPFRTGSSPWRAPASEAQRESGRQAGARLARGAAEPRVRWEETHDDGATATTLPAEPSLRPDPSREQGLKTRATLSGEIVR